MRGGRCRSCSSTRRASTAASPFRCANRRSCDSRRAASRWWLFGAATTWPRSSAGSRRPAPQVAKTALFSLLLGLLIAWNWGRLEDPSEGAAVLLIVALGIAPALLPSRRWRLAGAAIALWVAASIALEAPPWALGRILGRAWQGFLEFYDVLMPFDPAQHPHMHGLLLVAIFTFTALAALAVAARRPLLAGLVLVAGAGWPATIYPAADDVGRGALLLIVVLALVAQLVPTPRRGQPQVLVGTVIVIAAVVASNWNGVARAQFLNWQTWDLSTKSGPSVSVEYVWQANYKGVNFPKKRTRVFTVQTDDQRAVYWRAPTLDTFAEIGRASCRA